MGMLPAPAPKWTLDRIFAELCREHRRGRRLTRDPLVKSGRGDLVNAIYDHVGSMPAARRRAGVPDPVRPPVERPFVQVWDDDIIVEEIFELAAGSFDLFEVRY